MKLWLISARPDNNYDVYDSAVVAAETEEAARQTHPDGTFNTQSIWNTYHDWHTWVSDPSLVTATCIGEALPDTPASVIVASFNAG